MTSPSETASRVGDTGSGSGCPDHGGCEKFDWCKGYAEILKEKLGNAKGISKLGFVEDEIGK